MNTQQFTISPIPDDIFAKMQGKSFKDNCTVPREDLRYLKVLHVGFDRKTHTGELVVNRLIADDVLDIFKQLYEAGYEIEKIRLIDEYDADEEDDITRISDREFYVLGSANLNDVSEALSLHFTSDDYDTIGGYCLGLLDHLPEKNEIILTDNNILLRIDRMEKNRIERIYIRLPEPLEETGSEQKSEE